MSHTNQAELLEAIGRAQLMGSTRSNTWELSLPQQSLSFPGKSFNSLQGGGIPSASNSSHLPSMFPSGLAGPDLIKLGNPSDSLPNRNYTQLAPGHGPNTAIYYGTGLNSGQHIGLAYVAVPSQDGETMDELASLDQGRTTASPGSAYASRHRAGEQKRRARINERLALLRRMVPHDTRANTACFLEDVIKHIDGLKRRNMQLEAALAAASAGLPVPSTDIPTEPPPLAAAMEVEASPSNTALNPVSGDPAGGSDMPEKEKEKQPQLSGDNQDAEPAHCNSNAQQELQEQQHPATGKDSGEAESSGESAEQADPAGANTAHALDHAEVTSARSDRSVDVNQEKEGSQEETFQTDAADDADKLKALEAAEQLQQLASGYRASTDAVGTVSGMGVTPAGAASDAPSGSSGGQRIRTANHVDESDIARLEEQLEPQQNGNAAAAAGKQEAAALPLVHIPGQQLPVLVLPGVVPPSSAPASSILTSMNPVQLPQQPKLSQPPGQQLPVILLPGASMPTVSVNPLQGRVSEQPPSVRGSQQQHLPMMFLPTSGPRQTGVPSVAGSMMNTNTEMLLHQQIQHLQHQMQQLQQMQAQVQQQELQQQLAQQLTQPTAAHLPQIQLGSHATFIPQQTILQQTNVAGMPEHHTLSPMMNWVSTAAAPAGMVHAGQSSPNGRNVGLGPSPTPSYEGNQVPLKKRKLP